MYRWTSLLTSALESRRRYQIGKGRRYVFLSGDARFIPTRSIPTSVIPTRAVPTSLIPTLAIPTPRPEPSIKRVWPTSPLARFSYAVL